MHKGLTKKLDFEKAKLKAKATQADYRDRFVKEGDNFDRGGSHGNRITLRDIVKGGPAHRKLHQTNKLRAIAFFTHYIKSSLLKVDRWKFKFGFTPTQFSAANKINIKDATLLMPSVQATAQALLTMTLGRANKAALEICPNPNIEAGEPPLVQRLIFRTFLPTSEPVNWAKIFKRVLICPMEKELDE